MQETRALAKFKAWLDVPGHTQRTVAEVCGVAQSLVSAWSRGEGRPNELLRPALFVLTGIHPSLWRTADEKERFRATMRRAREVVSRRDAA